MFVSVSAVSLWSDHAGAEVFMCLGAQVYCVVHVIGAGCPSRRLLSVSLENVGSLSWCLVIVLPYVSDGFSLVLVLLG